MYKLITSSVASWRESPPHHEKRNDTGSCVPELLLSSVDSDNVTDLSLFEPSFPEQATNDVAQAITVANDKTKKTKNPP